MGSRRNQGSVMVAWENVERCYSLCIPLEHDVIQWRPHRGSGSHRSQGEASSVERREAHCCLVGNRDEDDGNEDVTKCGGEERVDTRQRKLSPRAGEECKKATRNVKRGCRPASRLSFLAALDFISIRRRLSTLSVAPQSNSLSHHPTIPLLAHQGR